jgi:multiple sugar transport system permease protein
MAELTLTKKILVYCLAAAIILVLVFPIWWIFITSVLPTRVIRVVAPPLIPPLAELSFEAYTRVFELRPVGLWIRNSAVVAIPAVTMSIIISTMAGYSLSRLASRVQLAMGYSLFMVKVIPTTLLVIPLFLMFNAAGLIDSLVSLMIANAVVIIPFATWLMKSFFDSIPEELEQAAMVDGCTRLQALLKVILPLSRPGIAAIGVYSGILAWGDFVFARTLVHGGDKSTITVGVVGFIGEYTVDWSALMAAGFVSVLPMVILFVLLEPLLVSGLTGGAVKE